MHNFKELLIWQEGIELCKDISILVKTFPTDERFGLISQMQRAAVSVPSNIAEGTSRGSNKGFAHYLSISHGSCFEIETQLVIANELQYITDEQLNKEVSKVQKIQKMIYKMINSLKS